jgi:hypothetical protein
MTRPYLILCVQHPHLTSRNPGQSWPSTLFIDFFFDKKLTFRLAMTFAALHTGPMEMLSSDPSMN